MTMSFERDHEHATATVDSAVHDDIAPGRSTRAAQLNAPTSPLISGLVRRKAKDANGVEDGAESAVATAATSSGSALPDGVRDKFEGSLGVDLSGVRVHTGAESATAASAVGARAYTVGNDIHFNAGQYDPSSVSGQHLLAHEVAHTVQQNGGAPTAQYKLEVSSPGDAFEVEADRAADAMVQGASTSVTYGSGVARKVMRDKEGGGEGKKPGDPAQAGGGAKGTWHLGEVKLGEKKVGFFDLGVSYSCDVNFEGSKEGKDAGPAKAPSQTAPSEPSNSYDQQHGKPPASTTVGTTGGKDGAGVQAEVKKELDGGFQNFKPALKGGYEASAKSVKVECGLEYETKWGPVTLGTAPLTFKLIKWEAGKTPEFAVAGAALSAAIPFKEWESGGVKYKLECQGKFEFEAKPDLLEIGKWFAENAAKMLTAEFLISAGLIVGGVLAIGAALYQIAKSSEYTERTEPEVRKCRAFCWNYHYAMRGEPMKGGEGAAEGYAAGKARLKEIEAKAGTPEGAAAEAAKNHDFYTEAWNKAWPQVKQRMIDSYWEEHYIEKALTGGQGQGNGGFKTFKMLIDGWDRA
jgi:Domain of unknown function (DUF4157)